MTARSLLEFLYCLEFFLASIGIQIDIRRLPDDRWTSECRQIFGLGQDSRSAPSFPNQRQHGKNWQGEAFLVLKWPGYGISSKLPRELLMRSDFSRAGRGLFRTVIALPLDRRALVASPAKANERRVVIAECRFARTQPPVAPF